MLASYNLAISTNPLTNFFPFTNFQMCRGFETPLSRLANVIIIFAETRKLLFSMLYLREICGKGHYWSFVTCLFFRRQQLEQPVYCESESRRAITVEDDRQDVPGANPEKVKVSYNHIVDYANGMFSRINWNGYMYDHDWFTLATVNHVALRMRARSEGKCILKYLLQSTTQDLFELLERVQSSRLDDQRCVLPSYFSQVCDKIHICIEAYISFAITTI